MIVRLLRWIHQSKRSTDHSSNEKSDGLSVTEICGVRRRQKWQNSMTMFALRILVCFRHSLHFFRNVFNTVPLIPAQWFRDCRREWSALPGVHICTSRRSWTEDRSHGCIRESAAAGRSPALQMQWPYQSPSLLPPAAGRAGQSLQTLHSNVYTSDMASRSSFSLKRIISRFPAIFPHHLFH